MGRKPRVFVEGGVYHVYCRTAHGERAFEDPDEAAAFVEVLRETKEHDGFLIYAWCLMANHYHLAIGTTRVPLWRSMATINVRVSKGYNLRKQLLGPLWAWNASGRGWGSLQSFSARTPAASAAW